MHLIGAFKFLNFASEMSSADVADRKSAALQELKPPLHFTSTYHNPIDRHWPVICELWKSIDRYWPLLTTPRTYHAIGVLISFRYRTSAGAIGVVNHGKNDNDSSYYVHMCEDYAALSTRLALWRCDAVETEHAHALLIFIRKLITTKQISFLQRLPL